MTEELLEKLRIELPLLISRKEAAKLGRWSAGTLANRDSAGTGPERLVVGGRTMYPREPFIAWFAQQIGVAAKPPKKKKKRPPMQRLAPEPESGVPYAGE